MELSDVERWSPSVLVVRGLNPGPFTGPGTNTFVVGGGSRPWLIDTGSGQPGYLPLFEKALREECGIDGPGDILVTHVHPDHIGGVPALIEHFGPREVYKMHWPERDARWGLDLRPIRDGDVFEGEGVTLRAIHTPGHSPDSICFYFEQERALFTGDLILGAGTTVIPLEGGDMRLYLESLAGLLGLEIERIYPAHGPLIADPKAKICEYIEHRGEREEQIIAAARAGATSVEAMVERIYVDTPRALFPAAGQSVLSHLLKLESEQRARRTRDAAGQDHWTIS